MRNGTTRLIMGDYGEENQTVDRLIELRATLSPEGDTVTFDVALETGPELHILATLQEVAQIAHVVRGASASLINRQFNRLNHGSDTLMELARNALRPVRHDMFADPFSDDWLFIFQFSTEAPFALRVDMQECIDNMVRTMRMVRARAN